MGKHDIECVRRTHFSGEVDLTARGNVMRTHTYLFQKTLYIR